MRRLLSCLSYLWAAPATALGLLTTLLALSLGARARLIDGVLEVSGGRWEGVLGRLPRAIGVEAITLGHVVLGRNPRGLAQWRLHERVHVRQYERWGVLFFPLYLGSSVWQWLRGRDPYRDNHFEVEAFRAEAPRIKPRSRAP